MIDSESGICIDRVYQETLRCLQEFTSRDLWASFCSLRVRTTSEDAAAGGRKLGIMKNALRQLLKSGIIICHFAAHSSLFAQFPD